MGAPAHPFGTKAEVETRRGRIAAGSTSHPAGTRVFGYAGLEMGMRMFRRAAWVLVLAGVAGCPVGCPKGKQQTIFEGPVEEVKLEEVGKCTYRATPPLQHPYPVGKGPMTGGWFVFLNDEIAFSDWVTYDPSTATFTITEHFCKKGYTSLRVEWHSLVRTVNE